MLDDDARSMGEAYAKGLLSDGMDMDSVLMELRNRDFSPMDCIRAVMALTGASLADSMRVVHFSSAWPELTER